MTFDNGADNKPQAVIPGACRDPAGLAQLKANAPLKGRVAQQPTDFGLFGDEKDQTELNL